MATKPVSPTALRASNINSTDNNTSWLKKLVVLISYVVDFFFGFLLRIFLSPPQTQPSGMATAEEGGSITSADDGGGAGKKPLFRQLIFDRPTALRLRNINRSKIVHRTELLQSRAVDVSLEDVLQKYEEYASEFGRRREFANGPLEVNRNVGIRSSALVSTSLHNSKVLEDSIATPAELVKAYMGSRPSKVSPSKLGMRGQLGRKGAGRLTNLPIASKSPVMSLNKESSMSLGAPENGFVTPRSQSRSAVYNMDRTPYSRVHPASVLKESGSNFNGYARPSTSSYLLLLQDIKPSKVSPSKLGIRGQLGRKEAGRLTNLPIASKSPVMSLNKKSSMSWGAPENDFVTPRSRSRSAVYDMDRTPYSTVHPTSVLKGSGSNFNGYARPSTSSYLLLQDIKPSKVSPSKLGMRGQLGRKEAGRLTNLPIASKSPVMSLNKKSSMSLGAPENGFVTPRSRSRSAVYDMDRTPYSTVHPASVLKGSGSNFNGYAGPSTSSYLLPVENNEKLEPQPATLKHSSSAFDDEVFSVGPMQRIRQKSNLLAPRFHHTAQGVGVGPHSKQRPELMGDRRNDSALKNIVENETQNVPSTSYARVPSRVSEVAAQILQQLERSSPKEKSSESKLVAAREKWPLKSTAGVLPGQAHRSKDDVGSSKLLSDVQDDQKVGDNGMLSDARDSSPRLQVNAEAKYHNEVAAQILQQLERSSPKEKSSESKLVAAREKWPLKPTAGVLPGQAHRSKDDVGSSKLLSDVEDDQKFGDNAMLYDARDSSRRMQVNAEANYPNVSIFSSGPSNSVLNNDSAVTLRTSKPNIETADLVETDVTQSPRKMRAFKTSAEEDSLEQDDVQFNGIASRSPFEKKGPVGSLLSDSTCASDEELVKPTIDLEDKSQSGLIPRGTNEFSQGAVTVGERTGAVVIPTSEERVTSQSASFVSSYAAFDRPKEATTSAHGGGGAGGKFRKKPVRRQLMSYGRLPTALRVSNINSTDNNNSWLKKLVVEPAAKRICLCLSEEGGATTSAHGGGDAGGKVRKKPVRRRLMPYDRPPTTLRVSNINNTASKRKSMATLKSHSEAERRRRERINAHLDTLRGLVPSNEKMDKATLFTEVINEVEQLNKRARQASEGLHIPMDIDDKATLLTEVINEVEQLNKRARQASEGLHIPMDIDEVQVEKLENNAIDGPFLLRSSFCCEYQPDVLSNVRQAIADLAVQLLKCDISTLGGRLKIGFSITATGSERNIDTAATQGQNLNSVRVAFGSILDELSASSEYTHQFFFPRKRQRVSYLDFHAPRQEV